jgi:hypothetical protein
MAEVIREAGIIRWLLLHNWLDAFEEEVPSSIKKFDVQPNTSFMKLSMMYR